MTISVWDSRLIKMTAATALFVAMAQPSSGQDLKYKPITVKTPDGLTISAQEWGNPAGAEILFIHGSHRAICRGCARSTATSPKSSAS